MWSRVRETERRESERQRPAPDRDWCPYPPGPTWGLPWLNMRPKWYPTSYLGPYGSGQKQCINKGKRVSFGTQPVSCGSVVLISFCITALNTLLPWPRVPQMDGLTHHPKGHTYGKGINECELKRWSLIEDGFVEYNGLCPKWILISYIVHY